MEFHARNRVLTGPELADLVAISPDETALKLGFKLQDPEVDDVVRTGRDLEAAIIVPDLSLSAEENVELLLRVARMLQLGLEVQFVDNEDVVQENNGLREELKVLEETSRALEAEVMELRELRDQEGQTSDMKEMELELRETRRALEDERKGNDRLIQQSDRDKQAIEVLESRVATATDELARKEEEWADMREQLERLRDDYSEMRTAHTALQAASSAREAQREMGDTIRQQDWKIERLAKDNRALEAANVELRSQVETTRDENLQVSEKILALDEDNRALRLAAGEAASKLEALSRERSTLLAVQEELRIEVADKLALLDEFEDRFNRQYKSWEEERGSLQAQLAALRKDKRVYANAGKDHTTGLAASSDDGTSGGGSQQDVDVQLAELRAALDEATEKEVLLLEAYEQLERDVGHEVDRALGRQTEELSRLQRRTQFLEGALEKERTHGTKLTEAQASLEGELASARERNSKHEAGIYGLPQAAQVIKALHAQLAANAAHTQELVGQLNRLSAAAEDLSDENSALRGKAGLPPGAGLDVAGLRLQKETTIAQLRSVNVLLERQVADLEEERRKMRAELKFRAKYHGRVALEMGLPPEQLLLLEEYVEGLKDGRLPEAGLVAQMQQRVEFLEVRLAEVMAYADIPLNMRPALSELCKERLPRDAAAAMLLARRARGAAGDAALGGAGGGGAVGAAALAAKASQQLEQMRAGVGSCLGQLKQMSDALADERQVTDADYRSFLEAVIGRLGEAEQHAGGLLQELAAAAAARVAAPTGGSGGAGAWAAAGAIMVVPDGGSVAQPLPVDNFMADAAAEELRTRLRELATQVVDLQVALAHKDAQLQQLAVHRAGLEARLGSGAKLGGAAGDFVDRGLHDEVLEEAASLRLQLLECLEQLAARERQLGEVSAACGRYQGRMQELSDTAKLLYRDYAAASAGWRSERAGAEKQLVRAQEEAALASAANRELEAALAVLEGRKNGGGSEADVRQQYVETVRRMAVVQVKHAKLARELEAARAGERAVTERLEAAEEELQDVSSTCRARMRWLEASAADATRRAEHLFRCLQGSAPLEAYESLVDKHTVVVAELRRLQEERGSCVADGAEELLRTRQMLSELVIKHDATCESAAQLREELRQAQMTLQAASGGSLGGLDLPLALGQELVAAKVQLDSLARRLELAGSDRDRAAAAATEALERLGELEGRLAAVAGELATARTMEQRLQQQLQGTKPAAEVEELVRRMEEAEKEAAAAEADTAALRARAEAAEAALADLQQHRQRQLADLTHLRGALRELMGHSDQAAAVGKLHMELDHCRSKEGLARAALNRSEAARVEVVRLARGLRQQLSRLTAQLAIQQDRARWSERELQDATTRMTLGLAGRTEPWKAAHWGRKLEQLKGRNDALAGAMEAALARAARLEDEGQAAALQQQLLRDVEGLLARGVSDAHREAAGLKDQVARLRLEGGKRGRGELLMRQKVAYLEHVNSELAELLDRADAESISAQGALEADKRQLEGHARQLQEEVSRLQERCAQLLSDLEEQRAAASGGAAGARAGAAAAAAAAGAAGAAQATSALADRELMLHQIESVKVALQEAEHMRQEACRLEGELELSQRQLSDLQRSYDDVLDRLQQQGAVLLGALGAGDAGGDDGAMVAQVRAVAEAALHELQARLAASEEQAQALAARLAEQQAAFLCQHQADRAEVAALGDSVAALRGDLARAGGAHGRGSDAREGVMAYEQLRALCQQRTAEVELLRSQVEQREASMELLKHGQAEQANRHEAEIARLAALASEARDTNPPSHLSLSKLQAELRGKDERLRQLRGAIKALEAKLAELLKERTDLAMQASSWREQELLDQRLAEAQASREQLASELKRAQRAAATAAAEAAVLRKELGEREAAAKKLGGELQRAGAALAAARAEVCKEQALVHSLRSKAKVADKVGEAAPVPGKQQQQQQQQLQQQLQQRVDSLQAANQQLQTALTQLQARQAVAAKQGAIAGDELGAASGAPYGLARAIEGKGGPLAGVAPPSEPGTLDFRIAAAWNAGRASTSDGGAAGTGASEGGGASAAGSGPLSRQGSSLAFWEETKKLQARVEVLRKKLAAAKCEADGLRNDVQQAEATTAELRSENGRAAQGLKEAQERLARAAAASAAQPASKLPEWVQRLTDLEEERDRLQLQLQALQRAQQQQQEGSGANTSSSGGAAGAGEQQLFELRLQRDQAQAAARRLRARISELFGPEAADDNAPAVAGPGPSSTGARGGGGGTQQQRSANTGAAAKQASAREAELLATVTSLKDALEKAMAMSTPTSKFMQEVQRRKAAAKEAEALKEEAAKLKQQLGAAEASVSALQAANAQARTQLQALREQQSAGAGGEQQLQAALGQRDAEVLRLQQQVAALQQRLQGLGENGGDTTAQAMILQQQLAALEAENADLRTELDAFDPQFFEEIEDMKHEHHQLTLRCEQQERQIEVLLGRQRAGGGAGGR